MRRKLVRVHFVQGSTDASIDGILLGHRGGHYHLTQVKFIQAVDGGSANTHSIPDVWIPKDRVLFIQETK